MASSNRRLRGLETEYCLRFTPAEGSTHPGNTRLYDAIVASVGDRTTLRPADAFGTTKSFLSNGGALNYERLPQAPDGGLLEAATPECHGPRQLFVYQRAQERLLLESLEGASRRLEADGFEGDLGLLKNCRDAIGNVYGAQENYDCELASGPPLWLYRGVLVALTPGFAVATVLSWVVMLFGIVALLAALIIEALRKAWRGRMDLAGAAEPEARFDSLGEAELGDLVNLSILPWFPLLSVQAGALRLLGFRRVRKATMAFFVSRPVLTGCGVLHPDGSFTLSEKAPDVVHTMRLDMRQARRAVLDTGNLLKPPQTLIALGFRDFAKAFRRRQRLQVGLGDSNVATIAEYLKIATTGLVVDMAEAGWLDGAPHPHDPIDALQIWAGDPELRAPVAMRRGTPLTALEVQRWYLERAQAWMEASDATSLEEREAVRLWTDVLEALDNDPDLLIGKLDWVTKRWLLRTAGTGLPDDARMKIALRYHELGTGYLAKLEDNDIAPDLLDEGEVTHAMLEPPEDSPAALRAEILSTLHDDPREVAVGWERVRVGGRFGTVIRLEDFRPSGD